MTCEGLSIDMGVFMHEENLVNTDKYTLHLERINMGDGFIQVTRKHSVLICLDSRNACALGQPAQHVRFLSTEGAQNIQFPRFQAQSYQ